MTVSNYDSDGFYVLRRKEPIASMMGATSAMLSASTVRRSPVQIGERMLTPVTPDTETVPDYLDNSPTVGVSNANGYACTDNPKAWTRKAWDRTCDVVIPDPSSSTFRDSSSKKLQPVVRLIVGYKAGVVVKTTNGVKKQVVARFPDEGLDYVPIDSIGRLESVINEIATRARAGFTDYYATKSITTKVVRNYHTLKLIIVYNDASFTSTVTSPRQMMELLGLRETEDGRIYVPMKDKKGGN